MRRIRLVRCWLPSVAALGLGATPAAASELRFSQTAAGQIVSTGNTLGLSKEFGLNGPGVEDSIGTFLTLDAASVDDNPANPANPWPAGTTGDWTLNGSQATLDIPARAEVLYAELVWGGSTLDGSEDVTAFVDDPVTLGFGADTQLVSPDLVTALDISEVAFAGFPANYYMRSADVTDFVVAHLAGSYDVSGVPATQSAGFNSLNAAGWTLLVAYRDSSEPIRNLTIFVGGSFVDEDSIEDYDFAGFCTPPSGAFEGRAVVSTIEGDADITGDGFQIGESAMGAFADLAGPNNPVDNFFCSQLNGADGQLDANGTAGTANHDATGGFNVVGGRQGWDVTSIAVSSTAGQFSNGQTEAVLRATTTGDSFVPTSLGFAIEVNAPDFSGDGNDAGADPLSLALDESSVITVDLHNGGLVDATDLLFRAPLPAGLSLTSFTLDGNAGDAGGNAVDAAGLAAGVDIGTVTVDEVRQIILEVTADAAPADGDSYRIEPGWDYDYVSCVGEPPLTEPHSTAPVVIAFEPSAGSTSGLDDTAGDSAGDSAGVSETGNGTTGDAADGTTGGVFTASGSAGEAEGADGCGCRNQGRAPSWAWALLVLAAVRRRRGSPLSL